MLPKKPLLVRRCLIDTPCSCCSAEPTAAMKRVSPSISPLPHQFSTPIFHHPTSRCTISLTCNFSRHSFILGPSPDLICLTFSRLPHLSFVHLVPSMSSSPWLFNSFWCLCCFFTVAHAPDHDAFKLQTLDKVTLSDLLTFSNICFIDRPAVSWFCFLKLPPEVCFFPAWTRAEAILVTLLSWASTLCLPHSTVLLSLKCFLGEWRWFQQFLHGSQIQRTERRRIKKPKKIKYLNWTAQVLDRKKKQSMSEVCYMTYRDFTFSAAFKGDSSESGARFRKNVHQVHKLPGNRRESGVTVPGIFILEMVLHQ